MKVIRLLLQAIFGALVIAICVMEYSKPSGVIVNHIGMVIVFVLIICLLGPWWPSRENIEKSALDPKSKFNLPTDKPEIAAKVLMFLLGCLSLHHSWERFANPNMELMRKEKLIFSLLGNNGLVLFFLALGAGLICAPFINKSKIK